MHVAVHLRASRLLTLILIVLSKMLSSNGNELIHSKCELGGFGPQAWLIQALAY